MLEIKTLISFTFNLELIVLRERNVLINSFMRNKLHGRS